MGRAITDIQNMGGVFSQPEVSGEFSVIKGSAPVAEMRGYQSQVISYTKGVGKLICTSDGYRECHNTEVVLEEYGYDPDLKIRQILYFALMAQVTMSNGTKFLISFTYLQRTNAGRFLRHSHTLVPKIL